MGNLQETFENFLDFYAKNEAEELVPKLIENLSSAKIGFTVYFCPSGGARIFFRNQANTEFEILLDDEVRVFFGEDRTVLYSDSYDDFNVDKLNQQIILHW